MRLTGRYVSFFAMVAMMVMMVAQAAHARPVSYPGGWTWMQTNDGDMNGAHLHY